MLYEYFVGLRYLKAKRKQTFISLISWISVAGVAIGVAALIVVLSVMEGMHEGIREKILGTSSHIVITNNYGDMSDYLGVIDRIKDISHIKATAPFVFGHAMANSSGAAAGVVVRGISPELEAQVTQLSSHMIMGRIESLNGGDEDRVVIGETLADNFGLTIGDTIELISPFGRATPMGNIPKVKKFIVSGIFKMGMYDFDSGLVLVSIPAAQRFFNLGQAVTGIEIKIDDIYEAGLVSQKISERIGFSYLTRDWMEMNRNLFAALKLEKFGMFVILVLIVIVAAFNIISTLIMMVMEKEKDIAILKSMGATQKGIMKIFMLDGMVIGVAGTLLGCLIGYVLCRIIGSYHFIKLPQDIYMIDTLPVTMQVADFAVVSLISISISFLATIYPSWNASRVDPVEALRS
ncbi:MAG: lipoprotein-releasing ABC transporter permease subunit [Nitrospinae bacterium]|nr:lipoprotein-releasing ABC transporter permease subunit [Nitrospinota bacterium]